MINQKLDFGFSESLFTIKIDVFPLLQAFILTVVFFHENNHWKSIVRFSNQL